MTKPNGKLVLFDYSSCEKDISVQINETSLKSECGRETFDNLFTGFLELHALFEKKIIEGITLVASKKTI